MAFLTRGIRVALVERKDFLLLGLELSAELGCLKDLLSESLILSQPVHAHLRVQSQVAEAALLVLTELDHLALQVVIVLDDHFFLFPEFLVTILALALVLLHLK